MWICFQDHVAVQFGYCFGSLPSGLEEKKPHTFEEKKHNFRENKQLFSLLFILESSLIMFIRQNVLYLHV